MKKKELVLKNDTIVNLINHELNQVIGGYDDNHPTFPPNCSAINICIEEPASEYISCRKPHEI